MSIFILSSFCSAGSAGKLLFPAALQGILVFFCGSRPFPALRRLLVIGVPPLPYPGAPSLSYKIKNSAAENRAVLLFFFVRPKDSSIRLCLQSFLHLGEIERISSSGSLVSRGNHHNHDAGNQECRQQLIDIKRAAQRPDQQVQINTVAAPESIPAMAPARVVRFQKSENSSSGPKVAPKPAQAKDTMVKITLFSSSAMMIPMAATTRSVMREMTMTCLSVASFLKIPGRYFWKRQMPRSADTNPKN